MDSHTYPYLTMQQSWRRVCLFVAGLATILGITGLCGWAFNIPLFTTFLSDGASMKVIRR